MQGDPVLCVGQIAGGVGCEVEHIQRMLMSSEAHSTNNHFIFIDDSGQTHPCHRKVEHVFRFQKRAYTWHDGYAGGDCFIDPLRLVLERCDSPSRVGIVYAADDPLGSGFSSFINEYIALNMPGLSLFNVGVIPHHCNGGWSAYNIALSAHASLEFSGSYCLRKLDDTEHILQQAGGKKHKDGSTSESFGMRDIYSATACDIAFAFSHPDAVMSVSCPLSTQPLVDVRSSDWTSLLRAKPKPPTHEGKLRAIGTNFHSLHISTLLQKDALVRQAAVVSNSWSNESARTLLQVLRGSSPGLSWPAQMRTYNCSPGSGSGVCFSSPYGLRILKRSVEAAGLCRKAGAYAHYADGEDVDIALNRINHIED